MGMIMNLFRISKQEFDNFVAKPSLFEEWAETFYEDDDENDERLLDIDKAWGGILYLLTGVSFICGSPDDEIDSLNRIFFSAQLFDENFEMGYGPAHYLTPEQVAGIYSKIAALTEADLKARYNPEAMRKDEELYPALEWDEEHFEYLYDYFKELQVFFATATDKGEAVITFLN
ncbi:MAG: YfbM family protein [Flavobacteriaceae bacterium]|jgi:hypothetical protein|nr:YfbM family protein [Flavobacteriaceae bacterium]